MGREHAVVGFVEWKVRCINVPDVNNDLAIVSVNCQIFRRIHEPDKIANDR